MIPQPEIVYSDEAIIVVSKPAGMIVHPAPGHESGSLTEFLVRQFPEIAGVGSIERPGVVHRLDRETSGVMVFARTQAAYRKLRMAFESHEKIVKTYLAVLHGSPREKQGTLRTLIGRKPWDPKRMATDVPDGKLAITHWEVMARHGRIVLVEFKIETGRTHQIRVHAAHLGHPIVGDPLYGNRKLDSCLRRKPARMLLHAVEITLPHPIAGTLKTFAVKPPPDIIYA